MRNWMFMGNFKEHYRLITKRLKNPVESAVTKEQLKAIKTFQESLLISLYVSSAQNIELL